MSNQAQEQGGAMPGKPVIVFESESYRVIHLLGMIEIQDLDCDEAVAIETVHAVGIAMQILSVCGDLPVEAALAAAPDQEGR